MVKQANIPWFENMHEPTLTVRTLSQEHKGKAGAHSVTMLPA
jgi:hypothetical protein